MTLTKSIKVSFCAGAVLTLAACTTTATQSSQQVTEVPQQTAVASEKTQLAETELDYDPNKRVCKRQSIPGSNFKKKVCMTLQQWKDMQSDSRKATEKIQNRNRGFEPQR